MLQCFAQALADDALSCWSKRANHLSRRLHYNSEWTPSGAIFWAEDGYLLGADGLETLSNPYN